MQSNDFQYYVDRGLFYGGRLVYSGLEKGDNYDKLKKSIVISFVNGTLFPETDKIHTVFHLREDSCNIKMTDKLEFHYIELGKINDAIIGKNLSEIETL